jgi:hypothetical protein
MRQKSRLVLPCDPEYTAHREAERRRQETRQWLSQRERANLAPPSCRTCGKRTRRRTRAPLFALAPLIEAQALCLGAL